MIKINRKKTVISLISFTCFFIGYYFAYYSYDAFNYEWYINNIHKAELRFYHEPGFVWLSKIALWLSGSGIVATRLLYGFSFFILSIGVLQFGYLLKTRMGVRSSYVVLLSFMLTFPLLVLIVSTPRQAISLGFFFVGMCVFLDRMKANAHNKSGLVDVGFIIACAFLSLAFHRLSFILAFACFSWLFMRTTAFISLAVVFLISGVAAFFISDSFQSLVGSLEYSIMYYLEGVDRKTGVFRMLVYVIVSLMFIFFAKKQALIFMSINRGAKIKIALLLAAISSAYVIISHDVARIVYFPVLILWMIVVVGSLAPSFYIKMDVKDSG